MAPRPKFSAASSGQVTDPKHLKHKRRYCRADGCSKIVKSQGLCQRHGAKPRKCKVETCEKQAQGNFDRMCKSHFKAMKRATTPLPKVMDLQNPPPAQGCSIYDSILPSSINYLPSPGTTMPLIAHLKSGFDGLKPPAWHRNEERRSRGLFPIDNPATQLEGWERELVWMEILVLTGASGVSFRHLARSWGRDKGFHMVLAQFICERQGDVQRKKRQGETPKTGNGNNNNSNKGPAKKRRIIRDNSKTPGFNSADIWDVAAYGDADTNEALAADIFNFSAQEFEHVSSKWKQQAYEDSSEAPSSPSAQSRSSMASQAAVTAILGEASARQPPMAPTLLAPPTAPDTNSRPGDKSNGPHNEIPRLPLPLEQQQHQHQRHMPPPKPVPKHHADDHQRNMPPPERLRRVQQHEHQQHAKPGQDQIPPLDQQQQQQEQQQQQGDTAATQLNHPDAEIC